MFSFSHTLIYRHLLLILITQMDSNTSGYFVNHASLPSVYYQGKEDGSMIDLGLSLRTLQPQAYHPSGHGTPFVLNLMCLFSLFKTIKNNNMFEF